MIRQPELLRALEDEWIRSSPPDLASALRSFDALWTQALELGVLPGPDPLEGIEVDIRLARALHVR